MHENIMKNNLNIIKQITREAQSFWENTEGSPSKFPAFAKSLLLNLKFDSILVRELLDEALHTALPVQHYQTSSFSNFPICIAREKDVFLDLYFWVNSDTNIHSHSFVGAFMILEGQVQQTIFSFDQEVSAFEWLQIGKLRNESHLLLKPGACQEIKYLDEFIHQSLHTHEDNKITVTMCLRTKDIANVKLSSFMLPNIKLETIYLDLNYRKKMDACEFFYKLNSRLYKETILKTINSIDLKSRIGIMAFPSTAATQVSTELIALIEEETAREHGQEEWYQTFISARNFTHKVQAKLALLKNKT
jgi:hypothetical protein